LYLITTNEAPVMTGSKKWIYCTVQEE